MKTHNVTFLKIRILPCILALVIIASAVILPVQTTQAASISSISSISEPDLCGGWSASEKSGNATLPSGALKIFNKAMKGMTGVSYTPICYLGKQVVSGTNYLYLCRAKVVTPNAKTTLKVVTICKNLKGKLSIGSIKNFSLEKHTKNHKVSSAKAGGVTPYTKTKAATLPSSVKKAFRRATKKLTGISYTPVAYLGNQIVAGTNYSILCLGKATTKNAKTHLYVVTIYNRFDSTSKITSVYGMY